MDCRLYRPTYEEVAGGMEGLLTKGTIQIWVCLKMGFTLSYGQIIGNMMIHQQIWGYRGYHIFGPRTYKSYKSYKLPSYGVDGVDLSNPTVSAGGV